MQRMILAVAVTALALGTSARAGVITNTFTSGEAPSGWTGPPAPAFDNGVGLSGASFSALGVTFTFSDTTGEVYGAPVNWGAIVQGLQGPGDTTITLAFDHPSTFLSFDINLALGGTPGGSVVLDGINTLSFTTEDPARTGVATGVFDSGTVAPFTTATISFGGGPEFYSLGNLRYDPPDAPAVPEPAPVTLLGLALAAMASGGLLSNFCKRSHPACH